MCSNEDSVQHKEKKRKDSLLQDLGKASGNEHLGTEGLVSTGSLITHYVVHKLVFGQL